MKEISIEAETGETGGMQESFDVSKGSEEEHPVGKKAVAVSLEKEGRISCYQWQKTKRKQRSSCGRMTMRKYYKVFICKESTAFRCFAFVLF